MTNRIEIVDEKRRKFRGGHLIGFSVFFLAWITRSILKLAEIETDLGYTILMVVLLLSILFQTYFAVKATSIEGEIKKDPLLKEALNNELIRLYELKAWRTAFFSVIVFIFLVAVVSLFVDYNDIMLIFLTTFLIGFGAYNVAIYVLDR